MKKTPQKKNTAKAVAAKELATKEIVAKKAVAQKEAIIPPPKKSRIRNPEQTREKLLQATVDLLAEKGPEALSLKDAAKLANVSRGVAYQHFSDREHLLQEARTWLSDRLLESAKNIQPLSTDDNNISAVFANSIRNVTKLVLQNREAARLLITEALAGKQLDSEHPIYKITLHGLEQLKTSGVASADTDIEMLTYILLGSIATMVMLSYSPSATDVENVTQRFTQEWSRVLLEGMVDTISQKPEAKNKGIKKRPK